MPRANDPHIVVVEGLRHEFPVAIKDVTNATNDHPFACRATLMGTLASVGVKPTLMSIDTDLKGLEFKQFHLPVKQVRRWGNEDLGHPAPSHKFQVDRSTVRGRLNIFLESTHVLASNRRCFTTCKRNAREHPPQYLAAPEAPVAASYTAVIN